MKRKLIIFVLLLLPFAVASGQGKIYTKKTRMASYAEKTTKVVLPGNTVLDAVLMKEIQFLWNITPYEFCSEEEYDNLRNRPEYYFLRVVRISRDDNFQGLLHLALSQGGNSNKESLDAAFDIISIPFAASDEKMLSPLELAVIPAMIDIVQQYVKDAASSVVAATAGLDWYSRNPALRNNGVKLVCQDAVKSVEMLENYCENAAVAFILGPEEYDSKATYYHMVIGTDNHKLYSCHSVKGGAGFSGTELKMFSKVSDGSCD